MSLLQLACEKRIVEYTCKGLVIVFSGFSNWGMFLLAFGVLQNI